MRFRAVCAVAAAASFAGAAAADIVQVEIEGKIFFTGAVPVSVDDVVSVRFSYDTAEQGVDVSSGSGIGTRFGSASLLAFSVGDDLFAGGTSGFQQVGSSSTAELYVARWSNLTAPSFSVTDLDLSLGDDPGTLTSLDRLPAASDLLKLSKNMYGRVWASGSVATFDVTSVRAVTVPLPPAAWAGLAGLGLVAGVRRLRRSA